MNVEEKIGILTQLIQKEKNESKKKKYIKLLNWLKSQSKKSNKSLRYGDFSRRFNKTQIEQETKDLLKQSQKKNISDLLKESLQNNEKHLKEKEAQIQNLVHQIDQAFIEGDNDLVQELEEKKEIVQQDVKAQSAVVKLGKSPLVLYFSKNPNIKPLWITSKKLYPKQKKKIIKMLGLKRFRL